MSRFVGVYLEEYSPIFHAAAYAHGNYPVIIQDGDKRSVCPASWGLVPRWVKDYKQALDIRKKTVNARVETLSQRPAFRHLTDGGRCLVPACGFFEFRLYGGRKYPYFIGFNDGRLFSIAALFDRWLNPETNILQTTFTLITKGSGPFISKIHNTARRMPAILKLDEEDIWLTGKSMDEIQSLRGDDDSQMTAHPVSRELLLKADNNRAASEFFSYDGLGRLEDAENMPVQSTLFG